jgi:hypothetical protein
LLRTARLQVQQRDNEVAILVSMLKRREAAGGGPVLEGAPAAAAAAAGVAARAGPAGAAVGEASGGVSSSEDLSSLLSADLLVDRNKAFELFRRSYRQNEVGARPTRPAPPPCRRRGPALPAACNHGPRMRSAAPARPLPLSHDAEMLLAARALCSQPCPAPAGGRPNSHPTNRSGHNMPPHPAAPPSTSPAARVQVIDENKSLLRSKYDAAKGLGAQVLAAKQDVAGFKARLEQRRMQRAAAAVGAGLHEEEALQQQDPEEERCRQGMEQVGRLLAHSPGSVLLCWEGRWGGVGWLLELGLLDQVQGL